MKVMVALHGDDPGPRLAAPRFRDELRERGATAVQVNVDDEPVRDALRFGPGRRVTAMLSIWLDDVVADSELSPLIQTVIEQTGEADLHAYRVTEIVRLDPVSVPDGTRADAMAQMALLRRPSHLTREEYLNYWLVHHTPIAIRTQNTSAYIQNVVEEALTEESPDLAAIVEEHFPMAALSDPHEFYGSRGDDAERDRRMSELMASVARFGADDGLDLIPTSRYRWAIG